MCCGRLRSLVETKVELPEEKQQPEEQKQNQPHVLSWHLVGRTQLRQERWSGQGIRFLGPGGS